MKRWKKLTNISLKWSLFNHNLKEKLKLPFIRSLDFLLMIQVVLHIYYYVYEVWGLFKYKFKYMSIKSRICDEFAKSEETSKFDSSYLNCTLKTQLHSLNIYGKYIHYVLLWWTNYQRKLDSYHHSHHYHLLLQKDFDFIN